nr:hypothetical protein RAR13_19630 [Aminobacter aminovorans]
MGYDVGIYAGPLSADDSTAWDEFETYLDSLDADGGDWLSDPTPPEPGSKMHTLYLKLIERFPCRTTLPEQEQETAFSPWRSEVWAMFGRNHAWLDMNFSSGPEVMPHMVELASELGLTILEFPAGHIHRPVAGGTYGIAN